MWKELENLALKIYIHINSGEAGTAGRRREHWFEPGEGRGGDQRTRRRGRERPLDRTTPSQCHGGRHPNSWLCVLYTSRPRWIHMLGKEGDVQGSKWEQSWILEKTWEGWFLDPGSESPWPLDLPLVLSFLWKCFCYLSNLLPKGRKWRADTVSIYIAVLSSDLHSWVEDSLWIFSDIRLLYRFN